ncbi:hypothetical protein V8C86DRAFT_2466492 [Haematococcus lacustris]
MHLSLGSSSQRQRQGQLGKVQCRQTAQSVQAAGRPHACMPYQRRQRQQWQGWGGGPCISVPPLPCPPAAFPPPACQRQAPKARPSLGCLTCLPSHACLAVALRPAAAQPARAAAAQARSRGTRWQGVMPQGGVMQGWACGTGQAQPPQPWPRWQELGRAPGHPAPPPSCPLPNHHHYMTPPSLRPQAQARGKAEGMGVAMGIPPL